jgi:predicted Zn-dependent protease
VSGYLRSIADRLLKQIPETGFAFHFAVFVDGVKTGPYEACVLPGGYIYVPESLILTARDEAEFAGMLGHAIAHAANRHVTRQASRANSANLAAVPIIAGGGWAGYKARQAAATAIPIALLQFMRGYELEADYRAVPMMADAGWDPEALARYIEREQVPDPRRPGTESRVFSPLPPREERVAAIRKAIGNLPPRGYSPSPGFAVVQTEVRRLNAVRTPKTVPPTLNPPQK